MWLCCCGGTEDILVCVHTKRTYTTSSSSGQVTRLDPDDGSEIWVSSLGVHATSGRVRRAVSCKIGPDGTIYVFFDYPASGSGGAALADYGGVCALDKADGSIIWENDLGSVSTVNTRPLQGTAAPASYNGSKGFLALYEPQDVADPTFSIWLAAYRQLTTENFLFEIDPADGSILQNFSTSILPSGMRTSPAYNVVVANDGDLYVSASASGSWQKISTSGTVLSDFSAASSHLRVGCANGELVADSDDTFWQANQGGGNASISTQKMILMKAEPLATNDLTVLEGFDRLGEWVALGGGLYDLPLSDHDIVDDSVQGTYGTSSGSIKSFCKKSNGGGIVVSYANQTYTKHAGGFDQHVAWIYSLDAIGRPNLVDIALRHSDHPSNIWDAELANDIDVYLCGIAPSNNLALSKWNLTLDTLDWMVDSSSEDITYPISVGTNGIYEVKHRTVPT